MDTIKLLYFLSHGLTDVVIIHTYYVLLSENNVNSKLRPATFFFLSY